jgi:hypothetical protein
LDDLYVKHTVILTVSKGVSYFIPSLDGSYLLVSVKPIVTHTRIALCNVSLGGSASRDEFRKSINQSKLI